MIEKVMLLASYTYFEGGAIGDFLSDLEVMGFFSYLLPFLLIFAIIHGILTQIKIFNENKAVNGIIAFVVGLLALQFPIVPEFFSEIFPRVGVGLAIILILLIMVGMFLDPKTKGVTYTIMGIAAIIFIIILINTAGAVGWSSAYWWYDNWKFVAGLLLLLALVGVIIGSSSNSSEDDKSPLARALRGD